MEWVLLSGGFLPTLPIRRLEYDSKRVPESTPDNRLQAIQSPRVGMGDNMEES
jgi:hypothetical protein